MKRIMDMRVVENCRLHPLYSLLKLTPADGSALPATRPGQFVQVAVEGSKTTFLRRPISINFVDAEANQLWLLVRVAGEGTRHLVETPAGEQINIVMPLGNGFSMPESKDSTVLLVGGGVGVAPLLQFGKELKAGGFNPEFLLGARSQADLLELDEFARYGEVHVSTDDGSRGEKGVVTLHSVLQTPRWSHIYCCGPAPMMKAVAAKARELGADCEVSLENMMACGIGACLCCVENTVKGNVCVCTEGPVFNIKELTW
ncbi:MAG: dihydroorotate dehydrogenase electron transfer subunit [Paramuribaculum sp.]|nr:dihydroorotate dehydrogenase electron transfer subunit [Paramuribaculum sp.]